MLLSGQSINVPNNVNSVCTALCTNQVVLLVQVELFTRVPQIQKLVLEISI